ncbi:MAG: type I methionyl aminopeptidase [Candidatus Promineifilaceae bacterium]
MYRRLKNRRQSKSSIPLKNKHEIELMKEAGHLVADCFALLKESIQPGVRLRDLDQKVELLIRERGALPLYKGYQGNPPSHPPFPGVICAAVNNEVCHGLPDNRRLRKGDIVGIDIGLRHKGYCGDACVTFPVGKISPMAERLLRVSEECMYKGIEAAQPGRMIGEVGVAIEEHARRHGYSVVVEWGGHGVGKNLHEAPSVPHTGPADVGPRLRPGMVFTVEPMVNMGSADNHMLKDGWTVVTNDGSLSSQFEHTIAITRKGPVILSPWHKTMA